MKRKNSFAFIRGQKQHAAYADVLDALRQSTGQTGNASTDPLWFATNAVESRRRPWTILMLEDGKPTGAVLLREQTRYKIPLGYFFACDAAGDAFVIAPPEKAESCLRLCMEAMSARMPSAVVFLATAHDYSTSRWMDLQYGSGQGTALYRLPILKTLDQTLQQFGSHTRRNLRYYSRNALRDGGVFLPALTDDEAREAGQALRPHSDYPVHAPGLQTIHNAIAKVKGGFYAGLRSSSGEWLSLLVGWRAGGRTSVFFQMNHEAHRKASLSTAMRALLIEHEVQLGQNDMAFVSYTNALTERGCAKDARYDLLLAKRSWRMALIARFSRRLPTDHRLRQCIEQSHEAKDGHKASLPGLRAEP